MQVRLWAADQSFDLDNTEFEKTTYANGMSDENASTLTCIYKTPESKAVFSQLLGEWEIDGLECPQ